MRLQAARRCFCAAWPGSWCGGAVWLWRRGALLRAEQLGGGGWGLGYAAGWDGGSGGVAGFKKGKPGISGGIRARGSPGISAGDHGNALLRGAMGKAEPTGGVGRAGSQGSRPARARAGLRVRERGRGLAEALAWARAGLGRARGGKERKTGPAGERNRTGRRERGAWVGFGTKLGWVLFYFFLLFYF